MSDRVIIIRYSELHLKGKNRGFFENKLINNIRQAIKDIDCKLIVGRGRYEIIDYSQRDESSIIKKLGFVFGIHSFSIGIGVATSIENIEKAILDNFEISGSFKIACNRADKNFEKTSLEVCRILGGFVLENYKNVNVDVHNPNVTINIDLRENKKTYIYKDVIKGAGGMAYGTAGKGVVMLSGGIDSPVASYMIAKRGLSVIALHFWSYPYTSENAKQKVIELKNIINDYCPGIKLLIVPFTKIQEAINACCESSYMITLVRRAMMRIANIVATKYGANAIVTGECLGQVASQTLESINVTNSVVGDIPVFRPLIGYDKSEVIDIANKIGTYDTSIKPYDDCCTVFLPDSPVTKPSRDRAVYNEQKIKNYQELLDDAVTNIQID